MPYRQIDCPSLGRRLSNIMAAPIPVRSTNPHPLDQYRALGGNCIHLHDEGDGTTAREETGRWLRDRNARDDFFLCSAICHDHWDEKAQKPICRFDSFSVREDIDTDLHLLGVNHLDMVYISDKPDQDFRPVIEALLVEKSRGRIGAFGFTSWTADRIRQAKHDVRRTGKVGASFIVTTELSLFKPLHPMWPEYVPIDSTLRQLIRDEGMTVFAWLGDVNQGQSLFGEGDALNRMKPQWISRWDTPENRAAARRIEHLAAQRNLHTRDINSAWVLNQDFPAVGIVNFHALTEPGRNAYLAASELLLTSSELEELERGC